MSQPPDDNPSNDSAEEPGESTDEIVSPTAEQADAPAAALGGSTAKLSTLSVDEMAKAFAAGGDIVTSAPPADAVGSLLSDLLEEAKKEVERERASLKQTVQDRKAEEREAQQREEAQRREALQKQLMEETRRRNEALIRREQEEAAVREAEEAEARKARAADAAARRASSPKEKPKSKAGLFAFVALVLVGGGGAAAYLLQPPPADMKLGNIESRIDDEVAEARKAWAAEQKEKLRLEAERKAAEDAATARLESERKAAEDAAKAKVEARRKAAEAKSAKVKKSKKASRKGKASKKRRGGKRLKLKTKGIF